MPELKRFEYFFLRYVPHPTMDDYVTFGVVMLEDAPNGFAGVRFVKNWRRVLCAHPDADLAYLRFLEQDIRQRLSDRHTARDLLARMEDCFSGSIQPSPYKQYLAEEPQAALEALAEGTLDIPATAGKAQTGGKRRILRKIQEALEQAGVWQMMQKNIPAEQYTYPGDPLKIDIAYRPNGVIKMLQALSLEANVESAKALAFSYLHLVAGIAGKEKAETLLTAVVADDLSRATPEIDFALGTLERSGIVVAAVAEMPQIAETARQELNV
jgi:hypothetical protein